MRFLLASLLLPSLALAQAGTYTTFGAGCDGSDLSGHVTPLVAATAWGNSANAWPTGATTQRWQQEIDASEMPKGAQPWTLMAFREDASSPAKGAQANALQVWLGSTTYSSTTLTSDYAKNANGTKKMTEVFKGTVVFPGVPSGNTDLKKFHYVIKFAKPYIWTPLASGENFLVEITNANTTQTYRRYPDCFSGTGTPGARLFNSGGITSTTGSVGLGHQMVLLFGNGAVPNLTNTGVPTINQAFSVDLDTARASSAAGLILGGSNSAWGPISLPLDLTPASAPGCFLLVSFDALSGVPTDSNGKASVKLGVPNDSKLLGVGFHNQYFVIDNEANALGLSFSNGGSGKVGK